MLSHTNSECDSNKLSNYEMLKTNIIVIISGEKLPRIEYTDEELKTWYCYLFS